MDDIPEDLPKSPLIGESEPETIYMAVGHALTRWEQMEQVLANLFCFFVGKFGEIEVLADYGRANKTFAPRMNALQGAADGYFRHHPDQDLEGAAAALVPAMLNIAKTVADETDIQPASLTSARSAYMADGTPLLELGLDQVLLRVALDHPGAVPKLQKIFAEFAARAGGSNARH